MTSIAEAGGRVTVRCRAGSHEPSPPGLSGDTVIFFNALILLVYSFDAHNPGG
jgi:hypothetical protein